MPNSDQLLLNISIGNEPKPWVVVYWVTYGCYEKPFTTKEEAWEWASVQASEDWCYVEGVQKPDGSMDQEWTEEITPWRGRVEPEVLSFQEQKAEYLRTGNCPQESSDA